LTRLSSFVLPIEIIFLFKISTIDEIYPRLEAEFKILLNDGISLNAAAEKTPITGIKLIGF